MHEGKFAHIPFITGNTRDEYVSRCMEADDRGTIFLEPAMMGANFTTEDFINSLLSHVVSKKNMAQILKQYPNDPTLGW